MNKIYILILIIIIALGVYFGWKQTPRSGEQISCTADALICPDGSGVGRTGPECQFSACPNQESFTGKLSQQGSEFFLAVPAPEGMSGEVLYSLPLKFSRISNVLAEFIGKEVEVRGKFTAGNLLEVDTIDTVASPGTGQILVGETKTIGGVRITVNKIIEDSRCPTDVVCIQAGRLVANVTLKSNTDQETVNLILGATSPKLFDIYKVSLITAEPSPHSSQSQATRVYKLTFKVE
jgi:hypothetical protein